MTLFNLLENVPELLAEELTSSIVDHTHVRIERIVSRGQSSSPGFWYDQEEHEWVAVLAGEAKLRLERDNEAIHLRSGDCYNIPARVRHRIEWTTSAEPTIWLAVFYRD